MGRGILFLLILTGFVWAQFEEGTLSVGSLFSYTSVKSSPDADALTTTTLGPNSLNIYSATIQPTLSYFISNNLSLDAIYSRTDLDDGDYDYSFSFYGPSASLYVNHLYAGGAYVLFNSKSKSEYSEHTSKTAYLELHGGLVHKLVEHVYVDINARYLMGTGDYVTEYSEYPEGDYTNKNEETMLLISAGIKAFFKLP